MIEFGRSSTIEIDPENYLFWILHFPKAENTREMRAYKTLFLRELWNVFILPIVYCTGNKYWNSWGKTFFEDYFAFSQ